MDVGYLGADFRFDRRRQSHCGPLGLLPDIVHDIACKIRTRR
jgi:hypothetical protein